MQQSQQTPFEILSNKMGAQIPVARSGTSRIIAFVLGKEETILLSKIGATWLTTEDRNGTIGTTAMGADNKGAFFMHYRIFFCDMPQCCMPVFATPTVQPIDV